MAYIWWFAIGLVLGIIELATLDLIFLMFALAAVATGFVALAGVSLPVQVGIFAVIALALLFLVRPWARSHLERSTPDHKTNAQALIGREAIAVTRVTDLEGRVRLDGDTWSARLGAPGAEPAGARLEVVAIDGATAVVARRGAEPTDPYGSTLN